MGKPTGFLEYERKTSTAVKPKVRIKNFDEFHIPLPMEQQKLQGARCMACGVPFCQSGMELFGMTSGCPLHNLIPEWNDLVYTGNLEQAYESAQNQQFPGIYLPGMSGTLRGSLHLRAQRRSGDDKGK